VCPVPGLVRLPVAAPPASLERLTTRLPGASAVLRSRTVWFWVATLGLAVTTWQNGGPFLPEIGLDPSWRAALHIAAHDRLRFGHDLLFTYGPLGFLSVTILYFSSTAAAAVAFGIVTQVGLVAALLHCARRSFGLLFGGLLVYVALALPISRADVILLILFVGSILALEEPEGRASRLVLASGGVVAAVNLLLKFNVGIVSIVLVALTAAALPRGGYRIPLWLVGSFLGTFLVLWLATGGRLGDIWQWVRGSIEIARGYSGAQALEQAGLEWHYFVAGVLLSVLAAVAWVHARPRPPRTRVAMLLVVLVYGFFYFKEGFVRHDGHAAYVFSAVALGAIVLGRRGAARWVVLPTVALAAASTLWTFSITPNAYFNPIGSAHSLGSEVRTLVDRGRRQALIEASRASTAQSIGVDPSLIDEIGQRTVAIDPYESDAAWAYLLNWRPLPVFQAYSADTRWLDEWNARFLSSDRAPERILRQYLPIRLDYRTPELESPATFLAMLCNYAELKATDAWQLLGHTSDRCGPARALTTVSANAGDVVAVPKPTAADDVVFARISVRKRLRDRLLDLFYKPVAIPGIVIGPSEYRFTRATASDPHVFRVPASAGFSPRFSGGLQIDSFQLVAVPSPFHVSFFEVELRPQT
jgi:hypothetical protein